MNTFEKASMALGTLVVGAGMLHNGPDWLIEQRELNFALVADDEEASMKAKELRLTEDLQKNKPEEASVISRQCADSLKTCLDGVQMPKVNPCTDMRADVKVFHETIAKPRESHLLNPQPEVYACDLMIQESINKCHREALYCLEKPLR